MDSEHLNIAQPTFDDIKQILSELKHENEIRNKLDLFLDIHYTIIHRSY